MTTLAPFPVDDFTLDQIEHALGGSLTLDDGADEPRRVGADFSLTQLLDFMSGYDVAKQVTAVNEYDTPIPDVTEYPDPLYTPTDVIMALVTEVRRLRGPS